MKFNVKSAGYDEASDMNPVVAVTGSVDGQRVCAKIYYQAVMFANTAGGVSAVRNLIAISFVNALIKDSNNPISAKTGGKQLPMPVYMPSKSLRVPLAGQNNILPEAMVGEWDQDVLVDNATTRKVADNAAWVESLKPKNRNKR